MYMAWSEIDMSGIADERESSMKSKINQFPKVIFLGVQYYIIMSSDNTFCLKMYDMDLLKKK